MIEEQKGTQEAEGLLEDLGFDSLPIIPSEVVSAISSTDFKVEMESKEFQSDNILGKAQGNDCAAVIYVNKNIGNDGRFNFTAAHEIGHVCMHIMPQTQMEFACGNKEIFNQYDDPIEQQANGFASGLLLPKDLVLGITTNDIDWQNLRKIKKQCKTSLEATYRRMQHLTKEPTALVIHKDGNFRRFVASTNFEFYIDRSPFSPDQRELCVDTSTEPYPSDFETVDASDWVDPKSKSITLESIYASSISLKDGFVYTLLSYDDDCILDEKD